MKKERRCPPPAHDAIAQLVKRGTVRVIVTTNFDDLIEQALLRLNIAPQVIAAPDMIAGCEPLRHSACTIIKVHGDYKRIDLLNTDAELEAYEHDLDDLLDCIFDEYGLLTSGWSADWDKALVAAVRRAKSRRYPLYWSTVGALGDNAHSIVDARRGGVIENAAADEFFPDLVTRLELLDRMATPPLTRDLAIARLKRCLPDPVRRLELRDLLDGEVERVRAYLDTRSRTPTPGKPVDWQDEIDTALREVDTLLHLVATGGIALDTQRAHDDLWIWTVEQLMRGYPRRLSGGSVHIEWGKFTLFPAYMVLKAASFATTQARRDDLLIRLHRDATKPAPPDTFNSAGHIQVEVTAAQELYDVYVLTDGVYEALKSKYGPFTYTVPVRRILEPILLPFVGDPSSFELLALRTEYRISLLHRFLLPFEAQAHGLYADALRSYEHFDRADGWMPDEDFAAAGVHKVWIDTLGLKGEEPIREAAQALAEVAKATKKWR